MGKAANRRSPTKHAQFEGIRVTPNVYTTLDEVDIFIDAMKQVLAKGARSDRALRFMLCARGMALTQPLNIAPQVFAVGFFGNRQGIKGRGLETAAKLRRAGPSLRRREPAVSEQ